MGQRWPSFKVPEHVVYFDYWTLSSLDVSSRPERRSQTSLSACFSIGLIAAKFGFNLPPWLERLKIWVPATTVAAYGRVTNG